MEALTFEMPTRSWSRAIPTRDGLGFTWMTWQMLMHKWFELLHWQWQANSSTWPTKPIVLTRKLWLEWLERLDVQVNGLFFEDCWFAWRSVRFSGGSFWMLMSVGPVCYEEIGQDGFAKFVEVNCLMSAEKLKKATRWVPKHGPYLKDIDVYFAAYQAFSHWCSWNMFHNE